MVASAFDGVDEAAGKVTQRKFLFSWTLALALLAAMLGGRFWQRHATVTDFLRQPRQQIDANHLLQIGDRDRRIGAGIVISDER